MTPASESTVAFTMIMNRMVLCSVLFCRKAPTLALVNHPGHVLHRANLPGPHLHAGVPGNQLNGFVEVSGLEDQEPAQRFLGLGVRPVRDRHPAVPVPKGGSFFRALEPFS